MTLETDLQGETDATVWARAFCSTLANQPTIASDFATMTGWFANAIESGRSAGRFADIADELTREAEDLGLYDVVESKAYARWKYAEEAAHHLIQKGHLIRIRIVTDVEHADTEEIADDESYVFDDYVVDDLGPRLVRETTPAAVINVDHELTDADATELKRRFIPEAGRFRSLPSEIDAIRWNGLNFGEVREWLGKTHNEQTKAKLQPNVDGYDLLILAGVDGASGYVDVPVGHWVASNPGDRSDVWPLDHGRMLAKYVPVAAGDAG